MLKHTLAKEEKKDCTVHYIPNSKKWYHFLWFDCPHVQVYISQYGFMFIYFQLVQKQNLPGPTGYSGIYIAFPLLRFQALFGGWKDF